MDTEMVKHQGVVIGAVVAAGFAGLHWLGRTAGVTRVEREKHLPGDELIKAPMKGQEIRPVTGWSPCVRQQPDDRGFYLDGADEHWWRVLVGPAAEVAGVKADQDDC